MYSLLDEPWIRAEDSTGHPISVSVREVFDGTVVLSRVRGESPAQDYAILRMLLAIFWRAHQLGQNDSFGEWLSDSQEVAIMNQRDDQVLDYLEKFSERFDLLHPEVPFMQVPDLSTRDDSTKEITMIVPEAQDSYFTMRAGPELDSLSLEEASRWLVYIQAFDYSGIKSGALGDPRVKGGRGYPIGQGWSGLTGATVVHGKNLRHTLVLNTIEEALKNADDRPVWERTPDGPSIRSQATPWKNYPIVPDFPMGPADLATWQVRRVRLFTEEGRVTRVVIANGDKIPDAGANVLQDPMTPYRWSKNKSTKDKDVYYPRPYDPTRTLWRALDALIVAETDGGFGAKEKAPKRPKNLTSLAEFRKIVPKHLDLELISVEYGPQSSSVASTVHSHVGMPIDILVAANRSLRRSARDAAAKASDSSIALGAYGGNLLQAAGGDYQFRSDLTDRLLSELEFSFVEWLTTLSDAASTTSQDAADAEAEWEQTVYSHVMELAETELRGAGPKALSGRILPPRGEGESPQVISAGSALNQLKRKLHNILPSTVPPSKEELSTSKGDKQ